jgi:murein DD-endopeptidase MepM/ murein hydrolase activator NlpD
MKRGRRLRGLCVLLLLASSVAISVQPATAASHLSETRRKLRAARARLAATKHTDADLLAVIGRLGGQLNSTRARLAAAETRLDQLNAMIAGEQRRLGRLDLERRKRASAVSKRARSLYILGPATGADALLASDSMDEFVARSSSLSFALRFDRAVMDDLARIADQSRKAQQAMARQKTAIASVRLGIAERASEIAEILQTQQVAEQALSVKINDYQQEVRQLELDAARILALIRSRQSRSTGRVSRRGFIWPHQGRINSPYGPRWGGFHTGIDIACHLGGRVVAAKAGRVIASEWGGGYGNMIIIDHGNGVSTLYAHNSRLYVHRGARVPRGKLISACGSTGNSTGSHLHFEVRINGEHTNPMPFLP